MNDRAEKGKFAVLVDGDNAQPSLLDRVLLEVTEYGRVTIKRIYGDWTTPIKNLYTVFYVNRDQQKIPVAPDRRLLAP